MLNNIKQVYVYSAKIALNGEMFRLTLVWTVNLTLSRSQRASGMSMRRDASLFKSTDTERSLTKQDSLKTKLYCDKSRREHRIAWK